ncbi:hypothetical protein GXW78_19315 [Roseomonas terrae]|uniref:AraC family transcriptional regulator n=1 Tax=Neoroseomonas terrae TaxID=424799 RepID=A0ABS5ELC2_9PROT|nr:hypothetical protein [Neoroseomonas terrae]MBR0651828.1 hypothetical protein [Neoroseomonas terrae]
MTGLLVLPPASWRPAAAGVAATFRPPVTGGFAVIAAGWPEPGDARLIASDAPPTPFRPFAAAAFCAATAEEGAVFTIEAPAPPSQCRVLFVPRPHNSPSLALLAPRAVRSPAHGHAYDLDAGRARVGTSLAAQEIDTALGIAAEMLLAARDAEATRQAVIAILAHLARYPLARSPALGAFAAALVE